MKSLLITGASGRLGQAVVDRLSNAYECIPVARDAVPPVDQLFGVLHIAGAFTQGSKVDDFSKMLDANLMSAVRVIESVREKISDGGRIVAIGSVASLTKPTGLAAYVAAKSALNAYIEVLAKELQKRRITVNALLPSTLGPDGVPHQRVIAAIAFLLSEDASPISGQLIAMTA
ncbi:MAG TPA: SDR family oxidoreductase [Thermoanaerobaculia bacterium]|nr:SDR family oxidoreductase [Thermoanaerobaculia bacterium]